MSEVLDYFEEGYDSFGHKDKPCPYKEGTMANGAWSVGYDVAFYNYCYKEKITDIEGGFPPTE